MHQIENKKIPLIKITFSKNIEELNKITKITIGDLVFDLTSKEKVPINKLEEAFCSLGMTDICLVLDFIENLAKSLPNGFSENNFNTVLQTLQMLQPSDPIELKLMAQHLLLDEIGRYLVRQGLNNDMMPQAGFCFSHSGKLFNLSQQAIQTLMKYRSKGVQQVNVVHMHDNSKAILANEVGGGVKHEKLKKPLDL